MQNLSPSASEIGNSLMQRSKNAHSFLLCITDHALFQALITLLGHNQTISGLLFQRLPHSLSQVFMDPLYRKQLPQQAWLSVLRMAGLQGWPLPASGDVDLLLPDEGASTLRANRWCTIIFLPGVCTLDTTRQRAPV